ncbi:MAG TPA: cytochrome C oxidase assembly protein [Paracoccaceae bacterium]|nr:cytochrome C oxidase assembly protein [Paracoccaceae bacterium]
MNSINPHHELHRRRKGRNLGVGLVLGAFVLMVFAVTIVKLSQPQSEDTKAPNYVTPGSEADNG